MRTFGAKGDGKADDTAAIQAAIDSGCSTLYLTKGKYKVTGPVQLRGGLEWIVGLESRIAIPPQPQPAFKLVDAPGAPDTVIVDTLTFTPSNPTTALDNASADRTLVIVHCKGMGGRHTGKGDVFIEDCGTGVGKPIRFGKQNVWIRQLSNEPRGGETHLVNDGGNAWILGHKTEKRGVLIETRNGGRTEVSGAFAYSGLGGDCDVTPMYINDNSSMSVTMGGAHFAAKRKPYAEIVEEIRGEETRILPAEALPILMGFRMLPLYVGMSKNGAE